MGRYIPLHSITAIMSADNKLLWKFDVAEEQRVDEQATYLPELCTTQSNAERHSKRYSSKISRYQYGG